MTEKKTYCKINPYLSIVVTARNDDHGGNLLQRVQIFINSLLKQCQHYKLYAELIIVEWNPPPDKPLLAQVISFPLKNNFCTVRIVKVPPEVHQKFKNSDNLLLFQMIAKNVGIRRAKGEFFLATNIDILFSDKLMKFLAGKNLKKNYYYRVDRYDVSSKIPLNTDLDKQLEFCKKNILRINTRSGTLNLRSPQHSAYNKVYRSLYRFQKVFVCFKIILMLITFPLTIFSRKPKILYYIFDNQDRYPELYNLKWNKQNISWRIKYYKKLLKQLFNFLLSPRRAYIYTNACGDFTLMAKKHWEELHGYPEFEMYSFHIDSVFLYMAYYNSLKEVILSKSHCIYHIEHSGGWSPEAQKNKSFDKNLMEKGIPKISNEELNNLALKMKKLNQPIIFNDKNWGLSNENLEEVRIAN